jgi:signal peptidase II
MNLAKRAVLILAVLIGCVGCDQVTKSAARSFLPAAQTWSFAGDSVRLQLAHNSGAFLSLGASLPERLRTGLFSLGVGCLLLCLLGYGLFARGTDVPGTIGLALIVGGGFSNLADRLLHGGYVIDFLNLGIGGMRTGIFNLADVAISAGAVLLLVNGFVRNRAAEAS